MIIFIYGEDTFRSRRFRQELQNKFQKDIDPNAVSLSIINGTTANLSDITDHLGAGSLFVKKRMVIVEDILKNKKEKFFSELIDYLKKIDKQNNEDDNVIIFHDSEIGALKVTAKKFFAFLLKQRYIQEFKPLSKGQIASFIKNEAELYQKKISLAAANELISRTGGDLWLISRSIKKLSFSSSEQEVSLAKIKEMVAGLYDENIFGLTDALSNKNRQLAIKLLEEQYSAGLSEEYILSMLIRQFKILLQIQSGLETGISPGNMATQLKLHPFVVKKGLAQARNFSLSKLKSNLNLLIGLDRKNKTGRNDIKTELILLISQL